MLPYTVCLALPGETSLFTQLVPLVPGAPELWHWSVNTLSHVRERWRLGLGSRPPLAELSSVAAFVRLARPESKADESVKKTKLMTGWHGKTGQLLHFIS